MFLLQVHCSFKGLVTGFITYIIYNKTLVFNKGEGGGDVFKKIWGRHISDNFEDNDLILKKKFSELNLSKKAVKSPLFAKIAEI